MNFALERGWVPVPFGLEEKMLMGLLDSLPQTWGRGSGNWGLYWF